jgi:phosphatidate cytidylyltransferase
MDKNLLQRIITGTLFVVVLVGCIMWNAWSMAGLFLLIVILGLHEFYKLAEKANVQPQKWYGIFFGAFIIINVFFQKAYPVSALNILLIPFFSLPFFIELFRKKENPFANIGWTLLGLFYIVVPFMMLIAEFVPQGFLSPIQGPWVPSYAQPQYNYRPLLTIFILIWTSDTMAYVCGRLFGKHKLWERISPKKTWEGFIGGFIFTVVAGMMIGKYWLHPPVPGDDSNEVAKMLMLKWGIIAAVISVTGMLGDLVESLFKRSINVKDSGNILPGHGGILDRFDALLLATPFALTTYYICDALLTHRF